MLYLAACDEARRFLRAQWPRYEAPLEETETALARLRTGWREEAAPSDWRAWLAQAVRESRANDRLMQQWLDQHA